jgi:tetratricopeptide (TPR) repeat protein
MRAGALAEAALCYRALVRLEPEAPRSYARLAHVYERMGAIRAAVEVCCQGLRRQPGARILHRRLAALLLQSEAAAGPVSRLLGVPLAVAWHGDASAYLTQMLASQEDTSESPVAAVAADEVAPADRLDVSP